MNPARIPKRKFSLRSGSHPGDTGRRKAGMKPHHTPRSHDRSLYIYRSITCRPRGWSRVISRDVVDCIYLYHQFYYIWSHSHVDESSVDHMHYFVDHVHHLLFTCIIILLITCIIIVLIIYALLCWSRALSVDHMHCLWIAFMHSFILVMPC